MLDVYTQFSSSFILPDYVEPLVSRISLEYLVWLQRTGALPTYQLVPVWCFYLSETDPISPKGCYYVQYFNAITGEYLSMG
jgi:hypothetical protein